LARSRDARPAAKATARAAGTSIRASAAKQGKAHFTHFDEAGRAQMVDVAGKDVTHRVARAGGRIAMRPETLAMIRDGKAAKGDVLLVARVAAIAAAKRAADLIPLCHPLPITRVAVDLALDDADSAVTVEATVETVARTGVEMEALTAVSAGLLTVYDMCKAVDRGMRIEDIRLLEKSGGRSGHFVADRE